MPEDFNTTVARKITDLEREIEKLKAGLGRHQMVPASGITRTVGTSGRDFTTIQSAINWFKGRQFSDTVCYIDVDAGIYAESLAIEDLDPSNYQSLIIRGDTRAVTGVPFVSGNLNATAWSNGLVTSIGMERRSGVATYAGYWFICQTAGTTGAVEPAWNTTLGGATNDNGVVWLTMGVPVNSGSIANCGSGYCWLQNSGNNLTITGTNGSNPNFATAGVVANDIVLVRNNSRAYSYMTVQSVAGNVITFTGACPAVGSPNSMAVVLPNRVIRPSTGNSIVAYNQFALYGFSLQPPNSGTGLSCANGGRAYIANIVVCQPPAGSTSTVGMTVAHPTAAVQNTGYNNVTLANIAVPIYGEFGNFIMSRVCVAAETLLGIRLYQSVAADIHSSIFLLADNVQNISVAYNAILRTMNSWFLCATSAGGYIGITEFGACWVAYSSYVYNCYIGFGAYSRGKALLDSTYIFQISAGSGFVGWAGGMIRALSTSTRYINFAGFTPYSPGTSLVAAGDSSVIWWS